jgi:hypothetical protein
MCVKVDFYPDSIGLEWYFAASFLVRRRKLDEFWRERNQVMPWLRFEKPLFWGDYDLVTRWLRKA